MFRRIEHALLLPNLKEPANACALGFQPKRFRIKRVDGSCRLIRSHLRTRHILSRLTPRGHGDCPVKRTGFTNHSLLGRDVVMSDLCLRPRRPGRSPGKRYLDQYRYVGLSEITSCLLRCQR